MAAVVRASAVASAAFSPAALHSRLHLGCLLGHLFPDGGGFRFDAILHVLARPRRHQQPNDRASHQVTSKQEIH
jgi:hypothetical protein